MRWWRWPRPRIAGVNGCSLISAKSCTTKAAAIAIIVSAPPKVIDGKVVAQKLLSCVYRTGQRFGAMQLIDVLVGRLTEKVTQFGHDKLSVFGVGRELNEKQWRAALRQLVAMGHLRADSEAFGALKLTESSRGVLRGETEVWLREQAATTRNRAIRGNSRRGGAGSVTQRRREGRSRPACRAEGVALGDRPPARRAGLCGAARFHHRRHRRGSPGDAVALRGIAGIGDKKLEHYGEELIALVKATGDNIGVSPLERASRPLPVRFCGDEG